jgi:type IV pilus assembly protein PilY1
LGKANGHFILVGGRGTAGSGFYALDVTNPKGSVNAVSATQSDSVVASRVLWEFPSASTPTDIVKSVGVSMGKPVIVNTHKYGPVVVLTSGYNSTLDGKGRVFVFDAMTGSLLHTFVTTAGTVGTGDAGLAQLAGFSEADGYVNNLYGGDLLGNVWRFGIEDGSVLNLATLTDSGAHSQPVTSAPELATLNGKRLVFVGTGQMLGKSDFGDNSTQSFYALWDNNTSIAKSRASLAVRTITVNGTRRSVVGSTVDWSNKRGWYVDLPAGEKANTDPSIAYGVLSFTTNSPSANTCTSRSALYLVNLATGLQLANSMFADGQAFYGVQLTSTLTARVSISRLPSGSITVTTHQSDDSTTSRKLAPTVASRPVKTAWKAILK